MECRVGPAMDIEYTFNVIWTRSFGNEVVRSVNDIPGSLLSNFSDFFTIQILTPNDGSTPYRCEVIVNFNQPSTVGSADFSLSDLTRKLSLYNTLLAYP